MTEFKKMTPEAAQEWIDALEGPYADRKGLKELCDENGKMCCLGVLADIRGDLGGVGARGDLAMPSSTLLKKYGLRLGALGNKPNELESGAWALAKLNDRSNTFAPVIAKIKEMFIDGADV